MTNYITVYSEEIKPESIDELPKEYKHQIFKDPLTGKRYVMKSGLTIACNDLKRIFQEVE